MTTAKPQPPTGPQRVELSAVPLFTTFFINWGGIGTGFVGSLGYWLSQQGVARGSQPLYYYLIVFPLYEYLPLILGLAGVAPCGVGGIGGKLGLPVGLCCG